MIRARLAEVTAAKGIRLKAEELAALRATLASADFSHDPVQAHRYPWLVGETNPVTGKLVASAALLTQGEIHWMKRSIQDGWPSSLGLAGYLDVLRSCASSAAAEVYTAQDGLSGAALVITYTSVPPSLRALGAEVVVIYNSTSGVLVTGYVQSTRTRKQLGEHRNQERHA